MSFTKKFTEVGPRTAHDLLLVVPSIANYLS